MLHRRRFLQAAAGTLAASELVAAERRPNIVFILADDLGYGHLGCYGQGEIRTPRIDRLAAEGMRFTQAYAGCTVCAPSRSALMTGQHTGHTPVRGNSGGLPLPDEATTVAELLKQAGYATGIFGKWGLGGAGTEGVPTRQGFDEFLGPLHQIHAQYYWPDYLFKNEEVYPLLGNEDGGKAQYAPDALLAAALDFLERHRDQPFFLYFPSLVPHHEYQVPADSFAEYEGRFPEPAPFIREDRGFEIQRQPAATIAGMITRFDEHVGRLVDRIDELGLGQNTLVILTSDNGAAGGFAPIVEPFNPSGPLRGYKGSLYEGGIRVPAVARWSGTTPSGGVSNFPWASWDFLPTAAELAGVPAPEGLDGQSIAPALRGESQEPHRFLYWETERRDGLARAVRMGDWKGVQPRPDRPLELYDLANDPGETTDRAQDEPAIVARLEAYLKTARNEPSALAEPGWSRSG